MFASMKYLQLLVADGAPIVVVAARVGEPRGSRGPHRVRAAERVGRGGRGGAARAAKRRRGGAAATSAAKMIQLARRLARSGAADTCKSFG